MKKANDAGDDWNRLRRQHCALDEQASQAGLSARTDKMSMHGLDQGRTQKKKNQNGEKNGTRKKEWWCQKWRRKKERGENCEPRIYKFMKMVSRISQKQCKRHHKIPSYLCFYFDGNFRGNIASSPPLVVRFHTYNEEKRCKRQVFKKKDVKRIS